MSESRIKILLVEDNPSDARLIHESLTETADSAFEIETADTLSGGLQRLSLGGIDAILLDLGLPDSFGQETFFRAKAHALGVAIIILTGLKDDSLALKLVQGGAQDFVAKVDVSGNNLTRAILYAIERERLEQRFKKLNEELEQRINERTSELQASNKELEAFSYSVSHDLRAPLVNIHAFSDLLLEKYSSQLGEQPQKYLRGINDGIMRMSRLIDDLLELSKTNRKELRKVNVSLSLLVAEVIHELRLQTAHRKIEWRIQKLPVIRGDQGLLKQVFANLISNAIKYTAPRDPAVIEIGQQFLDDQGVFFVRDNGVGFSLEQAAHLFSPFHRLHSSEAFEGSGIGLAIVQRIIEKHKGRIWADSQLDQGSTFYFTLGSREPESKQEDLQKTDPLWSAAS
jgi:signal transduction histidine kinase